MKKATQKAINAALAKYKADIIKQLTEAAPKAHIAGNLAALNKLKPIAVDFTLVQAEALKYSKDYSKLLYTKGGSMIDGKFVPWVKDLAAQKRQNIAKIISDGLKAGKPTTAIGGKALGKGTIAYDLAKECSGKGDAWAAMVARTETARIQGHGAMDRYKEQQIEEVKYLCGPDPCPICAANCQRIFKLSEAPEQPIHPRCVCDYAPVVKREKPEEVVKPEEIKKEVVKPTKPPVVKEKAVTKKVVEPKKKAIPETSKEKSVKIITDEGGITEKLKPNGVNYLGTPESKLKFTFDEANSASHYQSSGYLPINKGLRGKAKLNKAYKSHIKNIDSALKKSKVPEDIQTFRGISANQAEIIKKTNGCVNKGYTSTTYNPDNAFTFATRGEDKFFNLMELKVKKNTKALMWPGGENEVMLERGLKLKCTGIKEINNFAMKSSVKAANKVKKVRIFIMEAV